jgi:hypothetical protein
MSLLVKTNVDGNRYSEKGVGIIEFAIILPLFVLIVLGIIEFSRVVIIREELASLAREAANAAYRSCPTSGANADICNIQTADFIRNAAIASNYSPARLRVIISSYKVAPNESHIGAAGADKVAIKGQNFSLATHYDWTKIQNSPLNDILSKSGQFRVGYLVIGEVLYVHSPLFTFIPGVEDAVLYENAIF